MKWFLLSMLFFLLPAALMADEGALKDVKINNEKPYIVILTNGDILTGYVIEFTRNPEEGDGIKFDTELGTALIYESQIESIRLKEERNRHNHRVFLLPTANPIGNNHFIGAFELLFFYAGFGIADILSVTGGRTIIPQINSNEQLTVMNAKVTLLSEEFSKINRKLSLAVGGNLSYINDRNRLIHYYAVGSFELNRTSLHAAVFYKGGSRNIYDLYFGENTLEMRYADGAFGLGLGVDTRIPDTHGVYFIGELWNSNIQEPTHTGVLLGIRLCNDTFSADFGLSFFTSPFVAPFTSFVWTPF